jgi:hypothetical protein
MYKSFLIDRGSVMFKSIIQDVKFYFVCILTLLIFSLLSIFYLSPQKNVPIVLVMGFIALILSEYKSAMDIRHALRIANALKAEHVEEIMKKAEETYTIVKTIFSDLQQGK